jgi:hypothetical protein
MKELGKFDTLEEAMLAAEMSDALSGGTEPLVWRKAPKMATKPAPGHEYRLGADPAYAIYFYHDKMVWQCDFDSEAEAMEACEKDWEKRAGDSRITT